jgi:hypothetical protein
MEFTVEVTSLQTFDGKRPYRLLQAGSRAARGQITVSGMPNWLNYCNFFSASSLQMWTWFVGSWFKSFLPGDGPERAEIFST